MQDILVMYSILPHSNSELTDDLFLIKSTVGCFYIFYFHGYTYETFKTALARTNTVFKPGDPQHTAVKQ